MPEKTGQVRCGVCAICGVGLLNGVIWPAPGVFMVVYIVAEPCETKDVLKIIPCHTPDGVEADQACHNDAKARILHSLYPFSFHHSLHVLEVVRQEIYVT